MRVVFFYTIPEDIEYAKNNQKILNRELFFNQVKFSGFDILVKRFISEAAERKINFK